LFARKCDPVRMSQRFTAWLLCTLAAGCQRHPIESHSHAHERAPAPAKTTTPDPGFYAQTFSKNPQPRELIEVGRTLFFAPQLSRSGTMSCASCHDPTHAYGPPNDLAVQRGGADGKSFGVQAVPSLRYISQVPPYDEHHIEAEGAYMGLTGGFTWDGRATSRHDQARLPLFSPLEMANATPEELVTRLRPTPLGALLREHFGDDVFASTDSAMKAIVRSLEAFQDLPTEFFPYDSKYDAYLRHKVQLSPRELHGLELFAKADKGNCASCHPHVIAENNFPVFSDFGFNAIAVPRNRAIPANRDPAFFDLGLCGPYRTDLQDHHEYCGLFRVPSLRNVTRKKRFFHNGWATSLKQVLRFYALRDVRPAQLYPAGQPYDDLPAQYRANINMDPPFGKRSKPALSEAEMDDIIVFLGTLEDGFGYDPPQPKP